MSTHGNLGIIVPHPPDIPQTLVTIEVDGQTRAMVLKQGELRFALTRLGSHFKEATSRCLSTLRSDLEGEISDKTMKLSVQMKEAHAELETKIAEDPRMSHLEHLVDSTQSQLTGMEKRNTQLMEKVNQAVEKAETAAEAASKMVEEMMAAMAESSSRVQTAESLGDAENPDDQGQEGQEGERVPTDIKIVSQARSTSPQESLDPRDRAEKSPTPSSHGTGISDISPKTQRQRHKHSSNDPEPMAMERLASVQRHRSRLPTTSHLASNEELGKVRQNCEDVRSMLQETNANIASIRVSAAEDAKNLKDLEENLEQKADMLTHRIAKIEDRVRAQQRKVEVHDSLIKPLEERVQLLQEHGKNLHETLLQHSLDKADKSTVDVLTDKCEELRILIEQAAAIPVLEGKLREHEKQIRSMDDAHKVVENETEGLRHDATEILQRMEELADKAQLARAEEDIRARCAALTRECQVASQRITSLEATLIQTTEQLLSLESKAEQADVSALRNALSVLDGSVRDKEQSVLFGARCLSCNRVFDDISPNAGAVNLPGEKQRAQVVAEIQRALHSPKIDPAEPIKMIAVKVGRPSQLPPKSGQGQYPVRDADSLSCALEDVQLLRVPPGSPGSTRPQTSGNPARSPQASPQRPGTSGTVLSARQKSRPSTTQGVPGLKAPPGAAAAAAIDAASGQVPSPLASSLATLTERQWEGQVDFRHPLSHLLGRTKPDMHATA